LNAQVVVTARVARKLDDGLAYGIQAAAALQQIKHLGLRNQGMNTITALQQDITWLNSHRKNVNADNQLMAQAPT